MSDPSICGCHDGCYYGGEGYHQHPCTKPCVWPACMTEEEQQELVRKLREEGGIA